jgi:tRNA-splicing ligase RtcB (3'-phosphate/5'-hydroxy nucleic acid ligase)
MQVVTNVEGQRVPVKIWAEPEDMQGQDGAVEQAVALASHPLVFKHVALMPDFHQGFGMPIGGVAAMLDAVIPNAVGTDIGCGMMAVNTHIRAAGLTGETYDVWRKHVYDTVPCGKGRYHINDQPVPELPADANVRNKLFPVIDGMGPTVARMMGTLGDGNHFIELDIAENGEMWVMVHSGSRGLGSAICNHYNKLAKKMCKEWGVNVHPELYHLPVHLPEGQDYLREMQYAMEFAEENRAAMMLKAIAALAAVGLKPQWGDEIVHTHHNYAAQENHFGKNVWVHRKGAVRAKGRVIIPGSMGTASYIGEGKFNPESFGSCSHGAGRVMSRTQANKTITHEAAVASMAGVSYGIRAGNYDEMPAAYKDVDLVIARQTDLVDVVHRLTPLAVVKG